MRKFHQYHSNLYTSFICHSNLYYPFIAINYNFSSPTCHCRYIANSLLLSGGDLTILPSFSFPIVITSPQANERATSLPFCAASTSMQKISPIFTQFSKYSLGPHVSNLLPLLVRFLVLACTPPFAVSARQSIVLPWERRRAHACLLVEEQGSKLLLAGMWKRKNTSWLVSWRRKRR